MNVPVVWDGSYHFPLPNGEVIDPSFLPSFIDCDGVPLVPVKPVDLTLYDKFGGKPGGVPAVIAGTTVSYDTAGWGGFPVAYSDGCGSWIVNGNDLMIGQGTQNGCNLTWNTIADVAAWLTANDPYGLVWTVNGTLVEATTIGPNDVVYQVATCSNLPVFVDCDNVVQVPQTIPGTVSSVSVIPESFFTGLGTGTSMMVSNNGGGSFTLESTFANLQQSIDLFNMMNALIADPLGWAHEVIFIGNGGATMLADWPHGSITNPSLTGNTIRYTLDLSVVQITPAPSSPYLTNPPPSDFVQNKAGLLAAYQSMPVGVPVGGSNFSMELFTQEATAAIENAYQFVTCDNLADALAALADNQAMSSPNNTITVTASAPQAPDNQVNYLVDVNYVAGTTPVIVSDMAHPDAHSGKNSMYMGEPNVWLRIPWAASPTGFLVLPGYYQA